MSRNVNLLWKEHDISYLFERSFHAHSLSNWKVYIFFIIQFAEAIFHQNCSVKRVRCVGKNRKFLGQEKLLQIKAHMLNSSEKQIYL